MTHKNIKQRIHDLHQDVLAVVEKHYPDRPQEMQRAEVMTALSLAVSDQYRKFYPDKPKEEFMAAMFGALDLSWDCIKEENKSSG